MPVRDKGDFMTATELEPLTGSELDALDAYWRAANYLSVGQIYLMGNPLLTRPLRPEDVKPRLLGHWGTTPGLNLLYAHLNRVIRAWDLDMIFIAGPGHGGPAVVANTWLEGTYSEIYSHVTRDAAGMGAVPPVLVPRRDPQPRRTGDAGLDPRGRRARLRAGARLRRRLRQPRADRRLRDRRRRGGDRAAGRQLALEQVPQPGHRRGGAADPAPERVQDRQPDRARPHPRLRACLAHGGLRVPRHIVAGDEPDLVHQQLAARMDACVARDRRHPAAGPRSGRPHPAAVADDRAAHAQGLDRTEDRGRGAGRGHLPRAPGPHQRRARQSRAPGPARGVDAVLPRRGAVRPGRDAGSRAGRARRPGTTGG